MRTSRFPADTLPPTGNLINGNWVDSGDRFDADRARELRLVNKVVPRGDLDAAVKAYTDMLISKNQVSIGLGRRAFYAMVPMTAASRLEYAQTFLMTLLSAEGTGQVPVNKS